MSKENRRRRIISAAERLFTEKRFHEVKMDDVASFAGVGKGTIYRYFKDKDDLFLNTIVSGNDELCELLRQNIKKDSPFIEQLFQLCVQIGGFLARKSRLFRIMDAEGSRMFRYRKEIRRRLDKHYKEMVSVVAETICKGVDAGEVRRDIPCEVLALFLLGMLFTLSHKAGMMPASARRYDVIVDIFYNGVCGAKEKGKRQVLMKKGVGRIEKAR